MINSDSVFLTISEQIADNIRQDIIFGNLKEGESLKEVELSKKYKVSRGPIRDALKALSKEGFLISRPNKGVIVASHPGEEVLAMIIEFRKRVEFFVLEDTLESYTEEDFQILEEAIEHLRQACKSENIYAVTDYGLKFHKLIVQKHDDKHLVDLWQSIVNRMMFSYTGLINLMDCYTEHKNILEAMKKGDKKKVLQLIEKNIQKLPRNG